MLFTLWPRKRAPRSTSEARRTSKPARGHAAFRPRLEALEDRCVPSTLTVTNTLHNGSKGTPSLLTVTNTLDNGSKGSLRYEVALADTSTKATTIVFAPGLQGTITLNSGQLNITQNLTIQGPGDGLLTVSGGGASRIFEVAPNVTAAISGLTITQGDSGLATNPHELGGDILNLGTLTLSGCIVSDGSAFDPNFPTTGGLGGDIYNGGSMTLSGCTISGGQAADGGGIYNFGTMKVSGCTVYGNHAGNAGGGIYNAGAASALTVSNSVFGSLTVRGGFNSPDNIFGPYTDGGGNTFN
jgi:hypothetical protein